MMNVEDVRRRVARIEAMAGDDESAHAAEDTLMQDVLQAIADGATHPGQLAAEALLTANINFARWCA